VSNANLKVAFISPLAWLTCVTLTGALRAGASVGVRFIRYEAPHSLFEKIGQVEVQVAGKNIMSPTSAGPGLPASRCRRIG